MFEDIIAVPGFNDFVEVIGAFFIVFTISYALLTKVKLFEVKRFNTMISLVLALVFIFPHFTGIGPDYVPAVNILMPSAALLLIIVFSFLFLISLIGIKIEKESFTSLIAILIIFDLLVPDVLILAWLSNTFGWTLPSWISFIQEQWFMNIVITFALLGALIFFVTGSSKKELNY